jgi:hypothetical protein
MSLERRNDNDGFSIRFEDDKKPSKKKTVKDPKPKPAPKPKK